MAETVPEVSGVSSNGHHSVSGGEALSVWRSSGQVENGTPSTSPSYWDTDDDDDALKEDLIVDLVNVEVGRYYEIVITTFTG